jgi:hypothetical protein
MPLKLSAAVLGVTLFALPAAAAEPANAEAEHSTASKSEPHPAPPPASNQQLVPLAKLKSRPYEKLWFADFQVHDFTVGLTVLAVKARGAASVPADPLRGYPARTDSVYGILPYGGLHFAYYVPLVGYSPDFSVGLLPELQIGAGAIGHNYTQTTPLITEGEHNLGTVIRAPLFAMARLGYNASRYGAWPVCLNLGLGGALLRVNTGTPLLGTATYFAPSARVSVAFGFAEVGFETELGRYNDFSSSSEPVRMSYQAQTYTLSARTGSY